MRKYKITLPIFIFSLLFSYTFISNSFLLDNRNNEVIKNAEWITYISDSDIQYFRKTFYIPENVKNAWLTVSASDRYEIYVNGMVVGKEVKDGSYPAQIYDITNKLKTGKNIISIKIQKRKFAEEPKVIAEAGYETFSNKRKYIYTGKDWKASDYRNLISPSGLKWFDIEFNDSKWEHSNLADGQKEIVLDHDPEIFQIPGNSKQWFWAGSSNRITCSCSLEIPGKPLNAWIRLSSWGDFKIGINGDEVDSVYTGSNGTYENQYVTKKNNNLYIFDIYNELNPGGNIIDITSYTAKEGKGLYIDGSVKGNGWDIELSSKDFNCYNSQSPELLDKNYIAAGPGSFEQKIFKNNYNNSTLNIFSILKLLFLTIVVTLLLLILTFLFSKKAGIPAGSLSSTYLLPTLYLLSLFLLVFNSGFGNNLLFKPWFIILPFGLLFLMWPINILLKNINLQKSVSVVIYIILITVLFAGIYLRSQNINTEGLHWDEAQMSGKVEGIFERGYPSLEFSDGTPRYISTSELLVYIQSLSVSLLGQNLFSLRLPSLLFGILTIVLLFYFGKLIGGYRVGILSSAAYAVLPPAIGMSVFARYPSQLTFFSLLSAYLFVRYIYTKRLKFWIFSIFSLVLSYFSWQASALLSIPIILSRIYIGSKETLRRDILYFLVILAIPVSVHIFIKKLNKLAIEDYSLLGPSLSLTSFKFNFLNSYYDPFFYIDNFLFVEGFHIFAFLFFIGVPMLFLKIHKRRELLFLYFIIVSVSFIMTAILANNSYRYAFYLTPFLILIAGSVLIYLTDSLYGSEENKTFKQLNFVFIFLFFILFSSSLAGFQEFPYFREGLKTNLKLRNFPDFDKASVFLNQNVKKDDVVITMVPHLNNYYFDKLDYFFESRLHVAVFKNFGDGEASAYHKVVPIPAILSLGELKNVIYSTRGNVWLVASPERYKLFDQVTIEFLEKNRKLIYESFDTKIYLMNK